MSIAISMKAKADDKKHKEEDNPKFLAEKALDEVLSVIDSRANLGFYDMSYSYGGAHWRLVNGHIAKYLEREGFRTKETNECLFVYWDAPREKVVDPLM